MVVIWYEVVWYCNWLSECEGLFEDQWCYELNVEGDYDEGMKIKEDFWELFGYCLFIEVEWEFVC